MKILFACNKLQICMARRMVWLALCIPCSTEYFFFSHLSKISGARDFSQPVSFVCNTMNPLTSYLACYDVSDSSDCEDNISPSNYHENAPNIEELSSSLAPAVVAATPEMQLQPPLKKAKVALLWSSVAANICWVERQKFIRDWKSVDGFHLVKSKGRVNKVTGTAVEYYKCSEFRYGCAFLVKLECPPEGGSSICSVYTANAHTHNQQFEGRKPFLSKDMKQKFIKDGVEKRLKPGNIYRSLKKSAPDCGITLIQVQRAVGYLRKKDCSVLRQNTIGFLHQYLTNETLNSESPMDAFGILPGWVADGPDNVEDAAVNIHFVATTKRLLNHIVQQSQGKLPQFLGIDNTYNLTDNGFPITSVGTCDANHKFKRVALAVSRYENKEAFDKTISCVSDSLLEFFGFSWKLQVSCPDSAGAIRNSLKEKFPEMSDIPTCYFHNKQALNNPKNKNRFSSESNWKLFEQDVEIVHSIGDATIFQNSMQLFEKKWSRREKLATEWYMENWGNTLFNCGATPAGLPVANCNVEANNRNDKMFVTEHQRLALGNFVHNLKEEFEFESTESRCFGFEHTVTLDRPAWAAAQLWLKSGAKKYVRESATKPGLYSFMIVLFSFFDSLVSDFLTNNSFMVYSTVLYLVFLYQVSSTSLVKAL